MKIEALIEMARGLGASDLHLENGLPLCVRVNGELRTVGPAASGDDLVALAQRMVGEGWSRFLRDQSFDTSMTVAGTRCRINVMQTVRGVGLAIRLLSSFQATLAKLNLHPDLGRFARAPHGLVVISGPTGSGKSSTLAALVQEINARQAKHILTIESPIEYYARPQASFIRQRQVGRDTPSFEQALVDALREDPDVIVVGEMRTPEVMRLTLNAAETGHLVFTTLHSATPVEAVQRIISAFPAELERNVSAQLADSLVGIACQHLVYDRAREIRVPECEILVANTAARAVIRSGDAFKLPSVMETGRDQGMWSRERYRSWLSNKQDFFVASGTRESADSEPEELAFSARPAPQVVPETTAADSQHAEIDGLISQLEGKR